MNVLPAGMKLHQIPTHLIPTGVGIPTSFAPQATTSAGGPPMIHYASQDPSRLGAAKK